MSKQAAEHLTTQGEKSSWQNQLKKLSKIKALKEALFRPQQKPTSNEEHML